MRISYVILCEVSFDRLRQAYKADQTVSLIPAIMSVVVTQCIFSDNVCNAAFHDDLLQVWLDLEEIEVLMGFPETKVTEEKMVDVVLMDFQVLPVQMETLVEMGVMVQPGRKVFLVNLVSQE